MVQGKLIVFEGVEGSGKTTQLKSLQSWLQRTYDKLPIAATREPGGTDLGAGIRQLLLEPSFQTAIAPTAELLLYAADRAQHVERSLKSQLHQGVLVLCDRFTDSTIAYQGYGRGLDLALIEQLNQIATGGLTSDLTFWLDLPAEAGLVRSRQRGRLDRMEQADLAFHQRVQAGFRALHQRFPERIVRVDASLEAVQVAEQIQTILSSHLAQWYPSLSRPY